MYAIKNSFALVMFSMLLALASTSIECKAAVQHNSIETMQDSIKNNKMKIEIWSDVVCPFCYIGKREFEAALTAFESSNNIEIEWKSFQLMPDMPQNYGKSTYQYFADKYGVDMEQAIATHRQVATRAKSLGLNYNFDKAIPVNTLLAHQFIHFAKANSKQDQAEELLFYAYFTDGKNLEDLETLLQLGDKIGLDKAALKHALLNKSFTADIELDLYEAQQIGVRGVPFFVFDGKYAVSGAQASAVFLQTLEQSFAQWRQENPEKNLEVIDGNICTPNTNCQEVEKK